MNCARIGVNTRSRSDFSKYIRVYIYIYIYVRQTPFIFRAKPKKEVSIFNPIPMPDKKNKIKKN